MWSYCLCTVRFGLILGVSTLQILFCITLQYVSFSILYIINIYWDVEIPQLHTNNVTHTHWNFSWSVVKICFFIQRPFHFHKRLATLTLKLITKHDRDVTWANIRALYVLSIAYMLLTLSQKSVKPYCDIVYLLATRLKSPQHGPHWTL